jgi:acyl dehydratase
MSASTPGRRTITADDIRAYSRRGNYHSDPVTAQDIGLPGLVAQGVQVAGPAYAALLDAWGDAFLAHGECELRFVGMVLADQVIETRVAVDGETATIEVTNVTSGRTAVVGSARRTHDLDHERDR